MLNAGLILTRNSLFCLVLHSNLHRQKTLPLVYLRQGRNFTAYYTALWYNYAAV